MASMQKDLGSGSVKKLMLKMAVPALVGQIVNLLYNIVDRIYIGHIPEIGGAALTGVGLFMPILMLLNAFAMLVGSGGAPRVGIALGKGDRAGAQHTMGNCFALLLILALGAMELVCIGIIGEYVGRTFEQTKDRPIYIAKEILDGNP